MSEPQNLEELETFIQNNKDLSLEDMDDLDPYRVVERENIQALELP